MNNLNIDEESIATMLLSEDTLKKDWNNKYDDCWNKH